MKTIPDELAERILKKAVSRGGDYADIFVEHKDQVSLQLEDDKIEKVISGIDAGIGVRVIFRDRTAYAYSNEFSESALLHLADTVSRAAEEKTDVTINLKKAGPRVDFKIKLDPRAVGMERKIRLVEDANRTARKVSGKIRQVSVNYRDFVQNIYIATSDGVIAEDERIHTVAIVHVVAADGDVLQTGYEPVGGLIGFELFEEHSFEETARNVARKAVAMLGAQKISGGRMPVVISAAAGGTMIHEAVGHGLEADLVQQGLSVFSNRKGQQIASELVTVIDDSTLPNRRGSFRFDDEGWPSQRTVLVEKGILKGFMYDRLTAMKDKCASTGNGRRESYESRPIPRMTNTFIAPGVSDPLEIIRSVDRGFFVRKMGGGQVNTVTGEFVFEVSEGYIVEKGQISEPVRGATLIGNGPEVLRSIDMVGNDLGFSIGTCGKDAQGVPVSDAMPTVRIPDIVVGGKVQGG
ncbi:protease TldD [bacterium BMS3Abin10]|nr:protease TldD [bacterium BMS3Abin10]GBE38116.1 protease TldD [bacterium BMS3Bbin08]HDH50735.1 TldD/PmbA family protein [Nitrospirota bacterium]